MSVNLLTMMKVTINIFGLMIVISVSNSRNNVNTNFITIVNFNGNAHSNVYQDGLFMVTHTVESYQSNPFKTFYFYPKANILYRNLHSRAQKNCFVSFPLEIYTILVQEKIEILDRKDNIAKHIICAIIVFDTYDWAWH